MSDSVQDFLARQLRETREIVGNLRNILSLFSLVEKFNPDQKRFSYHLPNDTDADIIYISIHEIHVELGFKDGGQFFPNRMSWRLYAWVYWLYPILWRLNWTLPAGDAGSRTIQSFFERMVAAKLFLLLKGKDASFRYVPFSTHNHFYRHIGSVKDIVREARLVQIAVANVLV